MAFEDAQALLDYSRFLMADARLLRAEGRVWASLPGGNVMAERLYDDAILFVEEAARALDAGVNALCNAHENNGGT